MPEEEKKHKHTKHNPLNSSFFFFVFAKPLAAWAMMSPRTGPPGPCAADEICIRTGSWPKDRGHRDVPQEIEPPLGVVSLIINDCIICLSRRRLRLC